MVPAEHQLIAAVKPVTALTVGADPEFSLAVTSSTPNKKDLAYARNYIRASSVKGVGSRGLDGCAAIAELRPMQSEDPKVVTNNCRLLLASVYRSMKRKFNSTPVHEARDFFLFAGAGAPKSHLGSGRQYPVGGHVHLSSPDFHLAEGDFMYTIANGVAELVLPFAHSLMADWEFEVRGVKSSYGTPTNIRSQNWGCEYRALPSWLVSPAYTEAFLLMTKLAAEFALAFSKTHPKKSVDEDAGAPLSALMERGGSLASLMERSRLSRIVPEFKNSLASGLPTYKKLASDRARWVTANFWEVSPILLPAKAHIAFLTKAAKNGGWKAEETNLIDSWSLREPARRAPRPRTPRRPAQQLLPIPTTVPVLVALANQRPIQRADVVADLPVTWPAGMLPPTSCVSEEAQHLWAAAIARSGHTELSPRPYVQVLMIYRAYCRRNSLAE